ncbi:hypothetical protein A2G06_01065 [Geobacter anodireducens]|nr:hypothetical protein A2G06_01065 [Geobacter anodireducens]
MVLPGINRLFREFRKGFRRKNIHSFGCIATANHFYRLMAIPTALMLLVPYSLPLSPMTT